MLNIAVKDIPSAGIEIKGVVGEGDFDIRPEEIKSLIPLVISGKIERIDNIIYATVKAKGRFQYICGRCLEVYEKDFEQDFDFHYPVDPQVSYIDVGEDVREDIILGFSDKVLCEEECKGLCVHCGANLNNEKCGCKK
jgi:uncharacterized protein